MEGCLFCSLSSCDCWPVLKLVLTQEASSNTLFLEGGDPLAISYWVKIYLDLLVYFKIA